MRDVKSVGQISHTGFPSFTANTVLQRFRIRGIDQLTIPSVGGSGGTGVVTVTSGGNATFTGVTTDTIIAYQQPGINTETYNRVSNIASDGLSIELSPIVSGVNSTGDVYVGKVPEGGIAGILTDSLVTPFAMAPSVRSNGGLFAPLPNSNISSVDLTASTFDYFWVQITGEDTDSSGELQFDLASVGNY